MEVSAARSFEVVEETQAGEVRRQAMALARTLGFDDVETGRVGIVVSEAATNLVKHGRAGRVLLQKARDGAGESAGVEALALDSGPGMANLGRMMHDGVSTTGTAGTGLGAIARQSSRFDAWSSPGRGTALYAGLWRDAAPGAVGAASIGGVCVPIQGESVCGDGWSYERSPGRIVVLVTDGVGHGPPAHAASSAAAAVFAEHSGRPLEEIMARLHDALRHTRGAAAALAEIDGSRGLLRFCGVGNIVGRAFAPDGERRTVSQFGTLGHDARRIREFQYPWTRGSTLILHSDGLTDHWTLDEYAGLARREPALVAGILFRDHARGRDDCTVVVVRDEP